MKNNVYIRSNKSIFTLSITRILFLLPLIAYGVYKNGFHLYSNGYTNLIGVFRPLLIIFGGALIGALVNIIYEMIIKKNKDGLVANIFSSFHVEYGIVLGCLMPISINLLIYFGVLFVIFLISKFLNNRVNTMCVCFLIIYALIFLLGYDFIYQNSYELDKTFSLEIMDYLIGKGVGGIASTHIILLAIAFFGVHITNSSKTAITLSSIITIVILYAILAITQDINYNTLLFSNNILFIMTYVITDSVTSCYTINGKVGFGIIAGVLTFAFYFINPIIAPFIAIMVTSLFNNLIDRILNKNVKSN